MKDIRLVKIKTWDRMVKEFGLNKDGDIDCQDTFATGMEREMPKNRVIAIKNHKWWQSSWNWDISEDMIEEIINPKDYPQYFI